MNLISEYEQILIGNRHQFTNKNFPFAGTANERFALHIFKYAIEQLLKWTPKEASRLFTYQVAKDMKLIPLMPYISFPCELSEENTEYIVHLLYPKEVAYDFKKYVIAVYERVMRNEIKYPKDYMYGNKGLIRAGICLQYAIKKEKLFRDVEEMYAFFASPEGIHFIHRHKLHQLYSCFYKTPLDYLHHSIPDTLKNELYYSYYKFLYCYRQKYHESPLLS